MRDLLGSIDLPELLMLTKEQAINFDPESVNYNKAEDKLAKLVAHSKDYLHNALA